jgi:hypothetical protein
MEQEIKTIDDLPESVKLDLIASITEFRELFNKFVAESEVTDENN